MALINLRTTPKKFGYSPAQLLLSRHLRTKLPIITENLKPKTVDITSYCENLEKDQCYSKQNYDPKSKPIYLKKKCPDDLWYPGTILTNLD